MESLLINLKEQVTCAICLDTFTDPKTITCLHTFCCDCLKKHALISQRNGKFRCPECQAEVDLPEADCFDKLPSSFHHNRLLSLLAVRQSGDGNEISCGICKKKSAEISYCFECAKFMCIDWVVSKTKHSKTKTEARSTQISKTKHPRSKTKHPKSRKRSTQNSKTKHPRSKTKHPKLENEAPKTRKRSTQKLDTGLSFINTSSM